MEVDTKKSQEAGTGGGRSVCAVSPVAKLLTLL